MSIGKSSIPELDQTLIKLELIILVLYLLAQVLIRISNLNRCHLIHLEQVRDMVGLDQVIQMLEKFIHLMILVKEALGAVEDQYQLRWVQNHNSHLTCRTAFITKAGKQSLESVKVWERLLALQDHQPVTTKILTMLEDLWEQLTWEEHQITPRLCPCSQCLQSSLHKIHTLINHRLAIIAPAIKAFSLQRSNQLRAHGVPKQ